MSSLEKCSFRSSARFLRGGGRCLFFNFELHKLFLSFDCQSLLSCFVCKYFFPSERCLFILFMTSFAVSIEKLEGINSRITKAEELDKNFQFISARLANI